MPNLFSKWSSTAPGRIYYVLRTIAGPVSINPRPAPNIGSTLSPRSRITSLVPQMDVPAAQSRRRRPFAIKRPFAITKMGQLWRLVRESHENPITGQPRPAEIVSPSELGVTFIGHSSFFLQLGGRNILIDPVFATRLVVLRRQRRPGLLLEEMPPIDLVLVTHAHMDHLNIASLRRVIRATRRLRGRPPEIVVPNGVEDLIAHLGFRRRHTMKWWHSLDLAGLNITMTPCRHWGARMFNDTHRGYGGYVISTPQHSVYHSGDTAWFDGFTEIGQRLAPHVALLPIGAYFPDSYRTVHTSPEEAVRAFVETGAQWMVPM